MIILALDTAAVSYGVALVKGEEVLAQIAGDRARTHARRLMNAVHAVMEQAGLPMESIDGLAVTIGPGSFTGLRIGMATVQGIATALGKKVVGVSTLLALAHGAGDVQSERMIIPAIDARKGQVYSARFRRAARGLIQEAEGAAMDPEQWLEQVDAPALFVGDGALLHANLIRERLGSLAAFAPEGRNNISAPCVAALALQEFLGGREVWAGALKALYIRKTDARLPSQKAPPGR